MEQRCRKIAGTVSRFTARSLLLLARFISTYDEDTSTTTVVSTSGACATIHATPTSKAKPQSFSKCIRTCSCNPRIAVVASITSTPRWRFPSVFSFFLFFTLVKFSNTTQALCRQHTMNGGQCMVLGSGIWAIRETCTGIRKCRWLNNSLGKASTFVQRSCLGPGT